MGVSPSLGQDGGLNCNVPFPSPAFPSAPSLISGCLYRLGTTALGRPVTGCCERPSSPGCDCVDYDSSGAIAPGVVDASGINCNTAYDPPRPGSGACSTGNQCYYIEDGYRIFNTGPISERALLDANGFCVPPSQPGDACYTGGNLPGILNDSLECEGFSNGDACWACETDDDKPGEVSADGSCVATPSSGWTGRFYHDRCVADGRCADSDEFWINGICFEITPVSTGATRDDCRVAFDDDGSLAAVEWDCCPAPWQYWDPLDVGLCYLVCPDTGALAWNERPDGTCYTPTDYDLDGCSNDNPPCVSKACPPGTQSIMDDRCVVAHCNEDDSDCFQSDDPGEPCRDDECDSDDPSGRPSPVPIAAPDDDDDDPFTSTTSGASPGGPPGTRVPPGGGFAGGGAGGGGAGVDGDAGGAGDASGVGGASCPRGSVWRTDPDTGAVFCTCPADTFDLGGECVSIGGARGNFGATGSSFGFEDVLGGLLGSARRFAGFDGLPDCVAFEVGPVMLEGVERTWAVPPADVLPYFCGFISYVRAIVIAVASLFSIWQFAMGYREAMESMSASGVVGVIIGTTFSISSSVPAAWALSDVLIFQVDLVLNLIDGYSPDAAVVMDWFRRGGAVVFLQMMIFAISVRWSLVMSATIGRSLNWW